MSELKSALPRCAVHVIGDQLDELQMERAGAGENSACEWKIKRNNYPWIRMGELLLRIMVMVGLYRWYKTAKVLVSPWEL